MNVKFFVSALLCLHCAFELNLPTSIPGKKNEAPPAIEFRGFEDEEYKFNVNKKARTSLLDRIDSAIDSLEQKFSAITATYDRKSSYVEKGIKKALTQLQNKVQNRVKALLKNKL